MTIPSGLLFHIIVRGKNKQEIYLDSNDYEEFLAAEAAFWAVIPPISSGLYEKGGWQVN